LVAARHLAHAGWETHVVPAFPAPAWGELPRRKYEEAGLAHQYAPGLEGFRAAVASASRGRPWLILDGLLGIGSHGELREPLAGMVSAINDLRQSHHATVAALDLPTGLEADSGQPGKPCVTADLTLTVGAPKLGLMADSATVYAGRLVFLPLAELAPPAPSPEDEVLATAEGLARLLLRRSFTMHKGDCGRIAIVAGSRGLTGAARLCSEACVRAGAGLITLYVPEDSYPIVAAAAAPEVMVQPVADYREVLEKHHDVLAIGPGLGQSRRDEVVELLRESQVPTVIDADALNILTHHLELLRQSRAPRLLTPHPGEMARLDPASGKKPRRQAARDFTEAHPVSLLLKGARTIVAEAGRPLSYNSTGNPGMATGGMGDSLTGVCAALAGQGLSLYDAARLGAWLCGRAAEIALTVGGQSQESLTPVDLMAHLGHAFRALSARGY
jgi:NAD(P)H-hydrate epimerase